MPISRDDAEALLRLHLEYAVDQAIGDEPINRYELDKRDARPLEPAKKPAVPEPSEPLDKVAAAAEMAGKARNLAELRDAMESYEHCNLKNSARRLVFSDGRPDARLMIVGEAPGRDEDIQGKPFVGKAGRLLDAMFAAIDLSRNSDTAENGLYITNVIPWRPPGNRVPETEEIEMMRPFVFRHVELAEPELLVLMGNIACSAIINSMGITRIRGDWREVQGIPVMPTFHPSYLLRNSLSKRLAWHDLLAVKMKMGESRQ